MLRIFNTWHPSKQKYWVRYKNASDDETPVLEEPFITISQIHSDPDW